jgi:hypothetical protein
MQVPEKRQESRQLARVKASEKRCTRKKNQPREAFSSKNDGKECTLNKAAKGVCQSNCRL